MTRISDRLLVQRVDHLIVIMDETTGAEVEFPVEEAPAVAGALRYLAAPGGLTLEEARNHIGDAVSYCPYAGAAPEHGVIEGVGQVLVFVRYGTERLAKGTQASDLTLLA